jgi:hypothetical protein
MGQRAPGVVAGTIWMIVGKRAGVAPRRGFGYPSEISDW